MKKIFTPIFTAIIVFTSVTTFAQQATQTIRGVVIDDVSKTPLIGANVILAGSNPVAGASSDAVGNFKIANVPVGRHALKISYLGYEQQNIAEVIVTAGKEIVLTISLTEKVNQINEAVVSYDRTKDKTVTNNDMVTVSGRSFNTEDTKKYAGALGDPSRMAANFAGVIGANDSRNDIVVRGNSPSGLLWQLDGLNIPNPNHFGSLSSTGGPVSILNNNMLDKSDFLTGAFPAQYGNALSSVFDLRMRNGNTQKHEFLAQVGFNGFEADAEGPLTAKHNASYIIGYRYSTLGVFQALGINFGTGSTTPVYQDLSFKFFIPVSKKSKLSIFAIAGNSYVNFLGNEVDTTLNDLYGDENSNTRVKYATLISGITYETTFNEKMYGKLSLGADATDEKFSGDSISVVTRNEFHNGDARFKTQKYSASYQLSYKFNSRNSLMAGANTDLLYFDLFNRTVNSSTNPATTKELLADINDNTFLTQAFIQMKHRFTQKLSLTIGVHAQELSLNNAIAIEPRAGLKYMLNNSQSLSFGYGLHSQMQNIYLYFYQTPTPTGIDYTNKDLDFTKAHHFVLSYDYNISEHLRMKAETYYQSIFNAPVESVASSFSALNTGNDFGFTDKANLVNTGTGYNYGVELTVEKFYSKGYYFLLTASAFNSKYEGSDKVERNTTFNTNYVGNLLAGKEFKLGKKGNVLAADIKVSTAGGKYFTPLDYTASQIKGEAVYMDDKAFSEKQDPYFRIDLKVAYKKNYRKSTLELALDLQNLTNHQNIFRQQYNPRTNKIVNQYQQSFFPVPTARYTF